MSDTKKGAPTFLSLSVWETVSTLLSSFFWKDPDRGLLALMSVLSQSLFAFVGSHLVSFFLFSVRHDVVILIVSI